MVVGEKGLPVGSCNFHFARSRFPPGAHLGSRAVAVWRAAKRMMMEDLIVKDMLEDLEWIGWWFVGKESE